MIREAVQIVLATLVLVLGASAEEMLPKFCGVGFPVLLAANSFGLAVLFMWIVRDWWFGLSVGIWAILNSLIRTYLGVHFLGDIIVGAIAGSLIASMVYWIYRMCVREKSFSQVHIDKYSRTYTSSGFLREDISLFLCFLFGTYLSIMIIACVVRGII